MWREQEKSPGEEALSPAPQRATRALWDLKEPSTPQRELGGVPINLTSRWLEAVISDLTLGHNALKVSLKFQAVLFSCLEL